MIGGAVETVGGGAMVLAPEPTTLTKIAGGALVADGIDNFTTGAKQLWTGETENTLLFNTTKYSAKALGASDRNAERIATTVDISTIFLGGGGGIFKTIKALKAPSNASRVAEIAKANNIYSAQTSVIKSIIDKYYKAMKNGTYKSEGGAELVAARREERNTKHKTQNTKHRRRAFAKHPFGQGSK